MGVVNVRDRGRGGPGRKEPVEGASYPAPHPPHPWMPRGADHLPHRHRLDPTLCGSPSSFVGTEMWRVAISTAWHWPPVWKHSHLGTVVVRNTFLPAHFSKYISFVQAVPSALDAVPCFICLVVLLVPAETPLTLRCPFKLPWAGEVTCPPLPGFPQPLAQASRTSSPHCPVLIYRQGSL